MVAGHDAEVLNAAIAVVGDAAAELQGQAVETVIERGFGAFRLNIGAAAGRTRIKRRAAFLSLIVAQQQLHVGAPGNVEAAAGFDDEALVVLGVEIIVEAESASSAELKGMAAPIGYQPGGWAQVCRNIREGGGRPEHVRIIRTAEFKLREQNKTADFDANRIERFAQEQPGDAAIVENGVEVFDLEQ